MVYVAIILLLLLDLLLTMSVLGWIWVVDDKLKNKFGIKDVYERTKDFKTFLEDLEKCSTDILDSED